ncbi:MAG TPA: YCF48-related protein [Solimonas sp.]|nr:YCF48-related protein [Solimonas sp.]
MKKAWTIAGAALLGMLASAVGWAQDDGGGAAADAAAVAVKPMPAEIMPLTPRSLLLGVENTGEHLIAVGDRGAIIVSNDGKNWAQVDVPVRSALTSVAFADGQHGWAAGHDAAIVHTDDGGKTWKLQNFQPELEKPVLDLLALDAQHGIATGAYGLLLETKDGGQTWNTVDSHGFDEDELHLNSIGKLNNGDLMIAGEQGLLAISTDGGATWTKQASPYEGSYFGVLPHGDKGAMIFGLRGNVYVSDDARGGKWTALNTGTVASMFGGAAIPGDGNVLVGLNGVIMVVSKDDEVQLLRSPDGTPLSGVVPYGDDVFLAVGESGVQPIAVKALSH